MNDSSPRMCVRGGEGEVRVVQAEAVTVQRHVLVLFDGEDRETEETEEY